MLFDKKKPRNVMKPRHFSVCLNWRRKQFRSLFMHKQTNVYLISYLGTLQFCHHSNIYLELFVWKLFINYYSRADFLQHYNLISISSKFTLSNMTRQNKKQSSIKLIIAKKQKKSSTTSLVGSNRLFAH